MPMIQGLSKAAANYRRADNPKFSCGECTFMFPRLAINPFATGAIFGGCRYVRGVIHADDTCDEFKRRRPPPPEYKGPRVRAKVIMTPEARRMLKTLAHRRKLPMGEFLEALIREGYGKG